MGVPASGSLADYRGLWERKPVLRLVYDDFHDRIAAACRQGVTIEIGGGIGNLKRRLPTRRHPGATRATASTRSARRSIGAATGLTG
jgi:hypothetical protein